MSKACVFEAVALKQSVTSGGPERKLQIYPVIS